MFKDLALLVEDQGEHADKCARSFNKLSSHSCGSSLMFLSLSLVWCVSTASRCTSRRPRSTRKAGDGGGEGGEYLPWEESDGKGEEGARASVGRAVEELTAKWPAPVTANGWGGPAPACRVRTERGVHWWRHEHPIRNNDQVFGLSAIVVLSRVAYELDAPPRRVEFVVAAPRRAARRASLSYRPLVVEPAARDALEAAFWAVSEPESTRYGRHLNVPRSRTCWPCLACMERARHSDARRTRPRRLHSTTCSRCGQSGRRGAALKRASVHTFTR